MDGSFYFQERREVVGYPVGNDAKKSNENKNFSVPGDHNNQIEKNSRLHQQISSNDAFDANSESSEAIFAKIDVPNCGYESRKSSQQNAVMMMIK